MPFEKIKAIQRKQEDILKNMPMTAKRIRSAFPDLKLFEYWDNKNKENKKSIINLKELENRNFLIDVERVPHKKTGFPIFNP